MPLKDRVVIGIGITFAALVLGNIAYWALGLLID